MTADSMDDNPGSGRPEKVPWLPIANSRNEESHDTTTTGWRGLFRSRAKTLILFLVSLGVLISYIRSVRT